MANEVGIEDQPPPTPNTTGRAAWDLVIADMHARDLVGRERYGTVLQHDNGRDHLIDAYQEALDQVAYLRNEIEHRQPGVTVPAIPHRIAMATEIARLQGREQYLLERGTSLVEELRRTDRKRMVREFFCVAGQKIGERPHVPSDEEVRFRARLIGEEFVEILRALFGVENEVIDEVENAIDTVVSACVVHVDLPLFIDGTVDLDYVVEGARVAFGVDSTPVWQSVQVANMAKLGGPKRASDGKLLKPPGWTPPDIAAELHRQGWPVAC